MHAPTSSQYHLQMNTLDSLSLSPPPPPFSLPGFKMELQKQYLIQKFDSGLHTSVLWGGTYLVNAWCRLCEVVQQIWKAVLAVTGLFRRAHLGTQSRE